MEHFITPIPSLVFTNIDGFTIEQEIAIEERPKLINGFIRVKHPIKQVDQAYSTYEPTKAGRLLQDFVTENLVIGMCVYADVDFGKETMPR